MSFSEQMARRHVLPERGRTVAHEKILILESTWALEADYISDSRSTARIYLSFETLLSRGDVPALLSLYISHYSRFQAQKKAPAKTLGASYFTGDFVGRGAGDRNYHFIGNKGVLRSTLAF